MDLQQTHKDIPENRQALFALLDKDIKSNIGSIPVPDYLEIRAGACGFDSYAEMYDEGCRIAGYEKISPKVIEEWQRQKEQVRPSLKERLAREQGNLTPEGGNERKRQAHRGMQEL